MSIFNFLRNPVMEIIANVAKNAGTMGDTRDRIQGYVGTVTGSWIGGDEQAFEQEIKTRVIPMTVDFIAALTGLNTNTQKAVDIMDKADAAAKGVADQMKGEFSQI